MTDDEVTGGRVREVVRKRGDVLRSLRRAPARKPALVDRLSASRSTVDRAIRDLEAAGLVDSSDGAYAVTNAGELALTARGDYETVTDSLGSAVPMLDAVDPETPFDTALLDGADVRLADPHAPEHALSEALTAPDDVDSLRGFATVVKSNYVSLLNDYIVDDDLTVEIVVESAARESIAAVADARPAVAEFLTADGVTVLEYDGNLPYALWLLDAAAERRAGVTVHEDGGVVGVLTNDSPAAVDWCEDRYAATREETTPVDPSALHASE
ncbi:MAG: helix-turn-helix transcriptional regulator [Halolamina sp.]